MTEAVLKQIEERAKSSVRLIDLLDLVRNDVPALIIEVRRLRMVIAQIG
jgi:hypothetical protein